MSPTRTSQSTPVTHAPPKRWLVLSHAFNMDGRAASLTVTDKLPYLVERGVEPVILSGCLGLRDKRWEHHQFLPWGPAGLRFDLRHIVALAFGRGLLYRFLTLLASLLLAPFMVLERLALGLRHQWSWAVPAWLHGWRRLRRGDIELVYTSGGAYSAHLAGLWLKLSTGCRWIAEIHDPIVIPGEAPRNRDARFQAKLEGWMCRRADLVWWFTDGALAAARTRHPVLGERGLMVLPGANPPVHRVSYQRGERCVLGHFGSLTPTRSLLPALQGLQALLQRRPALRPLISLEVYGSTIDPDAQSFITQTGLSDVVRPFGRLEFDPHTGRSGRERVIERMQQVDVLLMMHGLVPECAEYIPSKLYDYFWARRPVLAFTWRNPQLDALVQAHDGFVAATDDPTAIETTLESVYERWARDALPAVTVPPVTVEAAVDAILRGARRGTP